MSSPAAMLEIKGLTRRFGGVTAVNDFDLRVAKGELVSLIGPNGAGKTTSFNLISGLDRPDAGAILFDGRPIGGLGPEAIAALGLARTFQHGRVFANLSVEDNVLVGAHTRLRAVRPRLAADRTARRTRAGARASALGERAKNRHCAPRRAKSSLCSAIA